MGIVLLIGLTVTVDWTIRLIILNSKLSGADSFQGTMQHCFGKSGLIAISIAQWAFAFGGMIAFCIIVGDTIPHVIEALFPGLKEMKFLWLLTDRRAVIVVFTICVSYPLSLYRDIAKVNDRISACGPVLTSAARKSIYAGTDIYVNHRYHGSYARRKGRLGTERRCEGTAVCQQRLLSSCRRYFVWFV
jgi:Transmembrane amino acid transporter protein